MKRLADEQFMPLHKKFNSQANDFFYNRGLKRQRGEGQPCLLPNAFLYKISCAQYGCSVVEFSPDGRLVAAACGEYFMFPIKIYDSNTGELVFTFVGHHDYIYDLAWSADGYEILSASSDMMVKLWNLRNRIPDYVAVYPHNSYVYAAQFHPTAQNPPLILTASYDNVVRVWHKERRDLLTEISEHAAPVNTLVFDKRGGRFFTGDYNGVIKIFEDTQLQSNMANVVDRNEWNRRFVCIRTVAHEELQGHIINCLRYSEMHDRLLVASRDNTLYIFGLRRYDLRVKLLGCHCEQFKLRAIFSPDAAKVMAGSEDGKVYIWDSKTSVLERVIDLRIASPVCALDWHPTQHLITASGFGSDHPIFFYETDSDANDAFEL
eukprot:TRINITY_DN2388_c0_g1_i6.p1 TRINITY_DN2388_c0_g1~~TRINITY_DN2388_c0_g1_i6.p1  ORF type:complete len:420 (+),score=61.76 TRINITY_DN2388_c0_g1_i6:131-1261(+)